MSGFCKSGQVHNQAVCMPVHPHGKVLVLVMVLNAILEYVFDFQNCLRGHALGLLSTSMLCMLCSCAYSMLVVLRTMTQLYK